MAMLTVIGPNGQATHPFKLVLVGGVTWTPTFSVNVNLIGNNLTVINKSGAGQGTCVYPEVAQSTGAIYWEINWTGLLNTTLQGGIGLCTIEAIADFGQLAADATGGCILRPDGTVWVNGQVANPLDPNFKYLPVQAEGDTVGILANFTQPDSLIVTFLGVAGGVVNNIGGQFLLPAGNYIPAAVFDSASVFDIYAQTANFGADVNSLLGPTVFPDFGWDGVTLGWPNTA